MPLALPPAALHAVLIATTNLTVIATAGTSLDRRMAAVPRVLPRAVVLATVADCDGEAGEGRATLGVAKLGIVGVSSGQTTQLFSG